MGNRTVNAQSQHNPDPDYAIELIQALRKQGLTTVQIAKRSGISKRALYKAMEIGLIRFPAQCTLECLLGRR